MLIKYPKPELTSNLEINKQLKKIKNLLNVEKSTLTPKKSILCINIYQPICIFRLSSLILAIRVTHLY